jgi:transcriptional regulator with XRE-family HTH domain
MQLRNEHFITKEKIMQALSLHYFIQGCLLWFDNHLQLHQRCIIMKSEHADVYKKLRFNITYARKTQGITQMQLAEKIGISRTHMSNIEAPNGAAGLSLDVLIDIANALKISVGNLLTDSVGAFKLNTDYDAESVFSDCTPAEAFVITQTINTLKQSLRTQGLPGK